MFKIIDNLNTYVFNEKPSFAFYKDFTDVPPNSLAKYNAIIVKTQNGFFALENVTIISQGNFVRFVSTKPVQKLSTKELISKKFFRKLKKIKKELNSKFQYGLSDNELELMWEIDDAYLKYQLLKKHRLSIANEKGTNHV